MQYSCGTSRKRRGGGYHQLHRWKENRDQSLHALKGLELKIMEKIYKLKEKVAYAFSIGLFLMVLARAISNLTP